MLCCAELCCTVLSYTILCGARPRREPQVVGLVSGLGLSWQAAFGVILTLYFYSHYFFASGERASSLFLATAGHL